MAIAERTAHIHWKGNLAWGGGTAHLETSGVGGDLPMSLPTRGGEANGHTSPEELLAASHAGCYAMSLVGVLVRGGSAPEALEVKAKVAVDRTAEGFRITRSDLTARGTVEGIDDEAFAEAARQAESTCPVSRALRGNMEITVDASLDGS